jgi:hypothetical protein
MLNLLLLSYALVHLFLLLWTFSWQGPTSWRLNFLRAMLFGMFYDNLITALGNTFIAAPWYEAANLPRFFIHSAVLPLLVLFALSVMQQARVKVADNTLLRLGCGVFVVGAIAFGLYHEVYLLELTLKPAVGIEKMGSASGQPPWATIATNILVLPMAAAIWRVSGWPWFFLSALFIFLVNGATGGQTWGFLAGNVAEIVFILGLLATQRHFGLKKGVKTS